MSSLLHNVFKIQCDASPISERVALSKLTELVYSIEPDALIHVDEYNNMFVTSGEASEYPCVVAHYDQVHKDIEDAFHLLEVDDILVAFDLNEKQQHGVGGDDKCGIYVCLKALERVENIKLVFFAQEEWGCVGSGQCNMEFFKDVSLCIQADRRGNNEVIQRTNGVKVFNKLYKKHISELIAEFGYKFSQNGTLTDVGELKSRGMFAPAMNLGAGYYNAHTDVEYVIISELENCCEMTIALCLLGADQTHGHKAEHKYAQYGSYTGGGRNSYNYDYSKYQWDKYDWEDNASSSDSCIATGRLTREKPCPTCGDALLMFAGEKLAYCDTCDQLKNCEDDDAIDNTDISCPSCNSDHIFEIDDGVYQCNVCLALCTSSDLGE